MSTAETKSPKTKLQAAREKADAQQRKVRILELRAEVRTATKVLDETLKNAVDQRDPEVLATKIDEYRGKYAELFDLQVAQLPPQETTEP